MRGERTFPTAKRCINRAPVVLKMRVPLPSNPESRWGQIVTEIEKLTNLREKLVIRRRTLAEAFQRAAPERFTGSSILQIQSAIEAVDRAIADEISTNDTRRRAVPIS